MGPRGITVTNVVPGLTDSERLNLLFAQGLEGLAELRLAFGILRDPEFLHAPYVNVNQKILELAEGDELAEAATTLKDYLMHSEHIALTVYARHMADTGLGTV